jgi:hypothetical protein
MVTGAKAPAAYQPDYTRCTEHFLLHAGGYAILRGIQKGLRWARGLEPQHVAP